MSDDQALHEYAYNYIYQDLVKDENDLLGSIAYAIYKRHKINWLKAYKQEHGGTEPSPEHVKVFNSISKEQIPGYRAQARDILDAFMDSAHDQMYDEVSEELTDEFNTQIANLDERLIKGTNTLLDTHHQRMDHILQGHQHGWWRSVGEHVTAGVVTTLLTGLMLLALSAYFNKDELIVQIKKNVAAEEAPPDKVKPITDNITTKTRP